MDTKAGSSPGFESDLTQFWNAHPFLADSSSLLVGVSGGLDSLALLHWLVHFNPTPSVRLEVVHVNHGLRPAADQDAAFVNEICASWQVPCRTVTAAVAAAQAESGGSWEAEARRIRYQLLGETAVELGSSYVLVAHHADDQAETVLMRLLRGSGLNGLGGMRSVSGWPLPSFPQLSLVRPLLETPRTAIEAYSHSHQLAPRVDDSNFDLRFTRNRVRHELIPILEQYNPRIRQQLAQTAALLRDDADFLGTLYDENWAAVCLASGPNWVRGALQPWRELPRSGQREIVRRLVKQTTGRLLDLSFEQVEHLCAVLRTGGAGQVADAGCGCRIFIYYDFFVATTGRPEASFDLPQVTTADSIPLPLTGTLPLNPGWRLTVSPERQPAGKWRVTLNLPPGKKLFLRGRRPGDRLAPAGMGGHTVKLKELLIDRKIPAPLRDHWPLITDEEQVLWVAGERLSAGAADPEWQGATATITIEKFDP